VALVVWPARVRMCGVVVSELCPLCLVRVVYTDHVVFVSAVMYLNSGLRSLLST
jgi:hypothetical protein